MHGSILARVYSESENIQDYSCLLMKFSCGRLRDGQSEALLCDIFLNLGSLTVHSLFFQACDH